MILILFEIFTGEIPPEPAPRSSLIEDAKVDVETPRKKKSAKKHKNKDKNINVPSLMTRSSELPSEPILPERPLSPDSALASSESSGSSLRKQGKIGGNNVHHGLVRIVPYQQFKPVLRKSANIQEKIAIFSQRQSSLCTSSTTGKTFPILRQHGNNHLNKVLYLAIIFFYFF